MPQEKISVNYLTVDESHETQRLDNYLINYLKGVPKSRIYRMIRKGEVRINKKRVSPDYRLHINDEIRIPPVRAALEKQPLPILDKHKELLNRILYEDERLIILNKPSGMPVHGGSGLQGGVIEILRILRTDLAMLELVHRLDKETSGCLVLAKNRKMLKFIHDLLQKKQVEKTYYALVKGHWPEKIKTVDAPLIKNILLSGERIVKVGEEGKESITKFSPLKYFQDATLIEAIPLTGRTHQIRVHTAYMGHEIAGDAKYGDKQFNKLLKTKGCTRLFLHAYQIKFALPEYNQLIQVTAKLDDALQNILDQLS